MTDYSRKLENSNFNIIFSDHIFADSTTDLASHKAINSKETQYSLEVKYRCKNYGGALINYELQIQIPDCGTTRVYWKKICGDPLMPRDNLNVDIHIKKFT